LRQSVKAFVLSLFLFGLSLPVKAQTNQTDFTSPFQIKNSVIERTQAGVAQVFAASTSGSGFFFTINGSIVAITNSHVIESSLQRPAPGQSKVVGPVVVRTAFGEEVRATVWKESQQHDIAILKLERIPGTVIPLELSDATVREGMEVFLWGAPRGISLVPLDGAIAGLAVNSASTIFAGAPVKIILARISIAPGNSGGPLLDTQGKVIGVMAARQNTPDNIHTGISVAIAADEFAPTIMAFDPREADKPVFTAPPTAGAPPIPRGDVRPIYPSAPPGATKDQISDFALGESQAAGYNCFQRLRVPPGPGTPNYVLVEPGDVKMIEFPLGINRIRSSRMIGVQNLELSVGASRDGADTFVCLLR
jgi:S1-C subfamily serine protease